jgi:iron complex outermembrane receptor protein
MEGYIKHIVKLTAALLLAGTSLPAIAQSTGDAPEAKAADDGIMIVTARKREENLQDVPLTIAVISTETIEKANLVSSGKPGEPR